MRRQPCGPLTTSQIATANWEEVKPGLPLFRQLVRDKVAKAMQGRAEIQNAPDDTLRAIQEARHRNLESEVSPIRIVGDAVVSAFFAADKAKAREKARADVESHISGMPARWDLLEAAAATLRAGDHGITPFHWQIEFPEVFARGNCGFDALVGNPPFLGGTRVSTVLGMNYFQWLTSRFEPCRHLCDLVGYFFRQAFSLLRDGGSFGLIATNTISQGDTREGSLRTILQNGGLIYSANRRFRWPGAVAVVVSIIHVRKDIQPSTDVLLDSKPASRINAYLTEGENDYSPARLKRNAYFSLGSKIYGQGFLFDDADPNCTPIEVRNKIVSQNPRLEGRIPPYIGGEEILTHPRQMYHRFAISLNDLQTEDELDEWPELRDIVREKVKPGRDLLGDNPNNAPLKRRWWAYQAHRPELYRRIEKMSRVLVSSKVNPRMAFTFMPPNRMFSQKSIVFQIDRVVLMICNSAISFA